MYFHCKCRPMKARQVTLPGFATRLQHGGDIRKGRRKLARPVDTKRPMHLVLRSTRAKGRWSLLAPGNGRMVRKLVFALAGPSEVRVYDFANSGNHIHLLVRARTRRGFQRYLRALTGLLARQITGARRGQRIGKFWDALAFSRVVSWGRDYSQAKKYLGLNRLEAMGGWIPANPPWLRP